MKHLFKLAAAAALAAGLALSQTTPAPDQPAQPGAARRLKMGRGMLRHRAMKALNLTDSQKQQAKAIFEQTKQNVKPIAEQLKQNREALAAAIKANNVTQIQTLAGQQGALQGQLIAARAESQAKFYALLTPEQRTKADQLHERVKQRMQQRFQKRGE